MKLELKLDENEFWLEISSLMHMWSSSDQGADYMCAFCGQSPRTNNDSIKHLANCYGQKILASIVKE